MMHLIDRRQWLLSTAALAAAPLIARAAASRDLTDWFLLPPGGRAAARVIQPAPDQLVVDGKIRAGVFAAPPRDANLMDASLFVGPRAGWRRKRLMEWFGYGVITKDWYFGMIIIDAKLFPISSVYVVNRRDRTTFSHDLAAGKVKIARNPWNDQTWARGPGYDLEFTHHLEAGRNGIRLDMTRPGKPRVRGELALVEDPNQWKSLNCAVPTQPPYFFYTHKAVMTVAGNIEIGDEKIALDPVRDLANLDEHRNYAQSPAIWTWGTGAAYEPDGQLLSFNLGDTGGIDQEHWNENCLWIGDRLELLGPVKWTHNQRDPYQPWTVREADGRAELTLTPQNGKVVALPPLGKYYQMAGFYNGFVIDEAGRKHEVKDLYGCAEHGSVMKYPL